LILVESKLKFLFTRSAVYRLASVKLMSCILRAFSFPRQCSLLTYDLGSWGSSEQVQNFLLQHKRRIWLTYKNFIILVD